MSGVPTQNLADAQAQQILNLVRQQLQLVLTSPTHILPGQPATATLVPATPVLDASELANGVLNLAWAAKDVLFNNPNAVAVPTPTELTSATGLDGDELLQAAGGIFGKQPFPPPLPGGAIVTQTSGLSGQLFGTYSPPQLKIGVSVKWKLEDSNGNELKEGENFIASQGLTSPTVSLLLPPLFRELRMDTLLNPGGSVVCLSVEITLRLGPTTLPPFTIGPVPIFLVSLLIPTMIVLFTEPNFGLTHDSAALVIVPEHSPFASAEPLFKTLKRIEAAVSALRSLGGLVSFFLGLDEILGAVPDQPRLRFVAARTLTTGQGVPKLGDVKIKRRPWYAILSSDPTFDDVAFSLIVFGPPGLTVQFFNDTNFKGTAQGSNQGNFDIHLRDNLTEKDLFASIRTLDTDDDVAPETFPPNLVSRFEADPNGDDRWHTDMSSVRFEQGWLDVVSREVTNPPVVPPLTCQEREEPPLV